ncbi:MAG: acyltransferase family protein [Candidatus Micrarchaeota archaeon]
MTDGDRLVQLDILKALAIIAVIILHTQTVKLPFSEFYLDQAVPIFLIVFALTSTISFKKRGYTTLMQMYNGKDFLVRLQRVLLPILIIYLIPMLQLPFQNGPGFYFIFLVIEFILLFPILYKIYCYNPKLFIAIAFILNLGFEIIAPNLQMINENPKIYAEIILRYLFIISLGMFVAEDRDIFSKKNRFILLGFAISVLYLVASSSSSGFFKDAWKSQDLFAGFYPLMIVLLSIRYLPKDLSRIYSKILSMIGKASYHIYIMQILFFSLGVGKDILYNLAYCIFAGLVFNAHKDKIEVFEDDVD